MQIHSDGGSEALKQRRHKLIKALGGVPALIQAGTAPPRNYPANQYDFRASSHFLYLAGLPLSGAALLIDSAEGRSLLFVPPPADDDALWHGEVPGMDALKAATGVDAVHPLPELDGWLETWFPTGDSVNHPPPNDVMPWPFVSPGLLSHW